MLLKLLKSFLNRIVKLNYYTYYNYLFIIIILTRIIIIVKSFNAFQWKFIHLFISRIKSCFQFISHPTSCYEWNFITINVDYGNTVSSIEIVLDVNQLNIFDLGYQVETEPCPPCQLVRKYQACKL